MEGFPLMPGPYDPNIEPTDDELTANVRRLEMLPGGDPALEQQLNDAYAEQAYRRGLTPGVIDIDRERANQRYIDGRTSEMAMAQPRHAQGRLGTEHNPIDLDSPQSMRNYERQEFNYQPVESVEEVTPFVPSDERLKQDIQAIESKLETRGGAEFAPNQGLVRELELMRQEWDQNLIEQSANSQSPPGRDAAMARSHQEYEARRQEPQAAPPAEPQYYQPQPQAPYEYRGDQMGHRANDMPPPPQQTEVHMGEAVMDSPQYQVEMGQARMDPQYQVEMGEAVMDQPQYDIQYGEAQMDPPAQPRVEFEYGEAQMDPPPEPAPAPQPQYASAEMPGFGSVKDADYIQGHGNQTPMPLPERDLGQSGIFGRSTMPWYERKTEEYNAARPPSPARQDFVREKRDERPWYQTAYEAATTDGSQWAAADHDRIPTPGLLESDREAKHKMGLGPAAAAFRETPGYAYEYKPEYQGDPGASPGQQFGVMAQDLERSPVTASTVVEDERGMKQVDTKKLTMVNSAALHDIVGRLDRLEGR